MKTTIKQIYKALGLCASVVTLMTMAACGGNGQQAQETEEEAEGELTEATLTQKQMATVGIEIGQMERKRLAQTISVSGQLGLDPQSRAVVSPLVGGVVRSFAIHEGQTVRAGQVVAYIENTDIVALQRDYLAAKQEMATAHQEAERQRLLDKSGAGVKKTLQQAESAEAVACASMQGLAQQLAQLGISANAITAGKMQTRIPVKSPIGGVVGSIRVSIGSYVDMQTPMMTVVDNTKLHCDLRVFERDIPQLRTGQTVELQLTNDRSVRMRGKVYDINSAFDDDSKAVKVHASLMERPAAHLMPGMYVQGLISVGEQEVDALPNEAIVSKEGKKYVYLMTEKKKDGAMTFHPVEVTTGTSALGYTQVTLTGEVKAGATYVKRNAFYISSMLEGETEED